MAKGHFINFSYKGITGLILLNVKFIILSMRRLILTLTVFLGLLSFSTPVLASITFDSSAQMGFSSGTSKSLSITIGEDSNRYLVVFVRLNDNNDAVTDVSFNSVSLTQLAKYQENGDGNNAGYIYIYGLANPDSGTHDIVVTANSSVTMAIFAHDYLGVNQTDQPDAVSFAENYTNSLIIDTTSTRANTVIVAQARSYSPGSGETCETNLTARTTRVDGGISGDYYPVVTPQKFSQTFGAGGIGSFNSMGVALWPPTTTPTTTIVSGDGNTKYLVVMGFMALLLGLVSFLRKIMAR